MTAPGPSSGKLGKHVVNVIHVGLLATGGFPFSVQPLYRAS
jgi:hypothetical protein